MQNKKIKRNMSAKEPVEKPKKELPPANRSGKGEQAAFVKKEHQAEEFKLSQLPTPPAEGRPSSVDAVHRFGKTSGST